LLHLLFAGGAALFLAGVDLPEETGSAIEMSLTRFAHQP